MTQPQFQSGAPATVFIVDQNGSPVYGTVGADLRVRIVAGAGAGGVSQADDSPFTIAVDSGTPVGGTFRTVRDLVDDNDFGVFAMTQRRAILASIEDSTGDSAMDDANNALRVNVVAGGAGGGVAQTQVRNAADTAWVNVGIAAALARMPVTLYTQAGTEITVGQKAMAASLPVVIASDQSAVAVTGPLTDTQLRATAVPVSIAAAVDTELTTADLDTGVGTDTRAVVGLVRAESGGGVLVGSANPLPVTGPLTDTQLRATAVPVSGPLTDTQLRATAVPISAASLPLPTGAATEATLDARTGILTETAPATDTASSGLNGRLQRVAQRLTSLIALLPAALVGGRLDVNLGAAPATVTVDSELPAAAALADAAANPTTPTIGGANLVFNGATWDRARGDTANGLDVDVTRQPARSRTVDAIAVADQTDALMTGLTALTPKFARINGALSGDNTLVAAVATKKIRVLALSFVAAGAVTVNFQTAAAGAYLAGPYTLAANGGAVLPYCPLGHFETVAGDLLNMELSAAVTVGGHLVYVEI